MKTFRSFTMVREPVDAVWAALRDRLPEIAARIDDLDSIVAVERQTTPDGGLALVNRWDAKQEIPALLRGRLGGDRVAWIDRATWDEARRQCTWSIEPLLLRDHVQCDGTTTYEPAMAGRGTRVTFEGRFALSPGFLAGLPPALEPLVTTLVEAIVSNVIPRSLAKAVSAAAELVAADRAASPRKDQPSSQA